jgi:phenylacetate-CoA ligase
MIEAAFNSKILSNYGMSERVVDATECEQHCGYHYNMEYGILELLDKNCEPINEPGIPGVVVGTGFHNNVMPLIRYQMFDVAVYSSKKCACKRNLPLIESFKGRLSEYFVGRSGKLVPVQLIWSGRHAVWSKIRELKFFQEFEGKIIARIVRAPKYSEEELSRELRNEVTSILTEDEFDVQFEFVESVPLTHRGSLHYIDQKIPLDLEDLTNESI